MLIVVFVVQLRVRGVTRRRASSLAGVRDRTLAEWHRELRAGELVVEPLGRKAARSDLATRMRVLEVLRARGPRTSARELARIFPEVTRAELSEMLARYRRVHDARYRGWLLALRWTRAGAIWAADHTDAPAPIAGGYRKIFIVRDLASGAQLLAMPTRDARTASVVSALEALFTLHGAPLALKTDLGSAFVADELGWLLGRWKVLHLVSPARWPRYNGACEAGIGSIKVRAHARAARDGRPGRWTCDDVEAARLEANDASHADDSTPEQRWSQREAISDDERAALWARIAVLIGAVRARWRLPLGGTPDKTTDRAVRRAAITIALHEAGILHIERGRLSPRVSR